MKKNKQIALKVRPENILEEKEMKKVVGSGNSQVRYIPDEYIQTRILSERRFDLHGKGI